MEEQVLAASSRAGGRGAARPKREPCPGSMGCRAFYDGYAVQERANALLEPHLGHRVGHKIGGTTETHAALHPARPSRCRRYLREQVHKSGATVVRADFRRLGIETEIAVRLALPLPPPRRALRPGRKSARRSAQMMAAIELVDDRYTDFTTIGAATLVADNAFDAGSLLGCPYSRLASARPCGPHRAHVRATARCSPPAAATRSWVIRWMPSPGSPITARRWGSGWRPAASSASAASPRSSGSPSAARPGSRSRAWAPSR